MDDSENLIPNYLSFVKGVVDSDDLPLNISREVLQKNSMIGVIKKNLTKKSLEMFADLAENKKEEYTKFYEQFSKQLKLGIHEDAKNRKQITKLLRFFTSKSMDETSVSLDDYISRMKEGQKSIYYITGESIPVVEASPFMEKLKQRGYEVLYMIDPIDEYMMQQIHDYDGKRFVCVTKDNDLFEDDVTTPEEKSSRKARDNDFAPLCKKILEILNTRVAKVQVSDRICDSPCVLVTDKYGWSANMERIMKAQAMRDPNMNMSMASRKILEINPDHVIIKELLTQSKSDDGKVNGDLVELIFDACMISSGFNLAEPRKFSDRIFRMITTGMSLVEDTSCVLAEDVVENKTIVEDEAQGTVDSTMEQVD
jgi:molecular chaperone HtpG